MTSGLGEYFPKRMRIRKRSEYLEVQRAGRKVHSRAFIGLVLTRGEGPTRLGITTPKRLGNAVLRNRTRRLIREAFRRRRIQLPEKRADIVIIAKKNVVGLDSHAVFDDLMALGAKVRNLVEQHSC